MSGWACIRLDASEVARIEALFSDVPEYARPSLRSYCIRALQERLQNIADEKEKSARKLLWQFDRVWMAVAANAYRRCRGAVPIEDLQDVAREEALKACRRVNGKGSPAPLIRSWANYGVIALLKERMSLSEFTLIYPDGDAGEERRSRWETLADEAAAPDSSVSLRQTEEALRQVVAAMTDAQRRIARRLLQGCDDDEIVEKTRGATLEAVGEVRALLSMELGVVQEPELNLQEAAALLKKSPQTLLKMIGRGELDAQRRGGKYFLRESVVRGLLRRSSKVA